MVFVKTDMVAKGISQDDIPENWVGRWANRSFRMRTMTVLESSPTNSPRRVDIQVGSRIYLSVCLNWNIAYALRWRVTHLG